MDGRTALIIAYEYAHLEIVKNLAENGAKDNSNRTALIHASINRLLEILIFS